MIPPRSHDNSKMEKNGSISIAKVRVWDYPTNKNDRSPLLGGRSFFRCVRTADLLAILPKSISMQQRHPRLFKVEDAAVLKIIFLSTPSFGEKMSVVK